MSTVLAQSFQIHQGISINPRAPGKPCCIHIKHPHTLNASLHRRNAHAKQQRTFPSRPCRSIVTTASLPPIAVTDSSSSSESDGPSTSGRTHVDYEALASAERSIAEQQIAGLPPAYSLTQTRKIVETAMLAAVAGLSYTLATLLKLEGYLTYALPLPVVIAALRGGTPAAVKCLTVAFLLLFILMGPVKAVTYLLAYGLLSLSLGAAFALRMPWAVSIPLGAVARVSGQAAYISLSSWVANENLLALVISNAHLMLDHLSVFLGTSGSPSFTAVAVTLTCMLVINAVFYVFMMHILYTLLLRGMGYKVASGPRFLQGLLKSQTELQRR